ncbi:MAG: type II toxin-antitoxin system VapC family toxin [Verrucomicrobiae bacterium]
MRIYFDTSALIKIYVREVNSLTTVEILLAEKSPVPFSHLVELELRTAIRLKRGRGEITAAEQRAVLQALESDLAKGVLARPDYDLDSVYRRAEAISAKHAAGTLARSADIWHVAAALEIGCNAFSSFDGRQRNLAALSKLKLLPA